jgi:MyTH4 domain
MHNGTSRSEKGSEKFVSFASLHFNLIGNNLGKLLKWEGGTYLTGPLLNLRPSLVSLALKANLLIVGYMDHSNNEIRKKCIDHICDNDVHLIYDLVKLGCQGSLDNSDEIRDEIFCQLVKQTTKNSNRRSCLRGYQLILCCLAGFYPTESLAPFLLSHIRVGCRGGALLSRRSVRLAEDCLGALQKIKILGSRTWGISRSEIFAIVSERKFLTVKVWISREITLDVAVDSWSTIADVKLIACEILGIQCSSILTLSMTANLNSELSSESNVASLRGLMNVLFNESRDKLLELIDKKNKKLKASARAKTLASLSEKALSTIDSLFQLKELSYLNFRGANPFNSSEACLFMESVQAEKNKKRSSFFLCTTSFFSPRSLDLARLLGRKKPSSTNFAFKIRLVVWIYPYSQRCEDTDQDHLKRCKLADHYQQRGGHCQPGIFDREIYLSMAPSHDECHLSERGINLNTCTRWPSDEIVREILFGQLIESTSGSLDDYQSLRMAGLMFAVQHQVQYHFPLMK